MKTKISKVKINKYNELIADLVNLSVKGLEEMYLPEKFEFAMKKKLVNGKVIIQGENLRYSLINLLGLHKAESHNLTTKLDLKAIVKFHLKRADKLNGVGDLGLLLWAAALISPEDIKILLPKINFKNILENFKDARFGYTMELSWFLTGLLLASTFDNNFKIIIGDLPVNVYNKIRSNYGGAGIFRHEAKVSLNGKFRGIIGSFADQVYPIYAFSLYSQQKNNEEAKLIAKECAQTLCKHQGENGEWMWHYNSASGEVCCNYPIYSVHQDAMAPFTLFAVQKATGVNFEKYIYKGLDWFEENAKNNVNMIDLKNNAVWRRIAPSNCKRRIKLFLALVGIKVNIDKKNLQVLYESWSYHLGWILFAFAGRVDKVNDKKDNSGNSNDHLKIFNFN